MNENPFWSRIAIGAPDECWPWIRAKPGQYGRWRKQPAHRTAYELTHGPITGPLQKVVRHRCDNKACCNPAHLELGSHQDNALDRILHGDLRHLGRVCENGHPIRRKDLRFQYVDDERRILCWQCASEAQRRLKAMIRAEQLAAPTTPPPRQRARRNYTEPQLLAAAEAGHQLTPHQRHRLMLIKARLQREQNRAETGSGGNITDRLPFSRTLFR